MNKGIRAHQGGMVISNRQDHVAENSHHQMDAQSRAQTTNGEVLNSQSHPQ